MKLRARWTGPPPRLGDYLASTLRPRFAYHIRAIKPVGTKLEIEVNRLPIDEIPPGSLVHDWRWDSRAPRKRATFSTK